MALSLIAWWTRDTPLHSFLFCQFLIGLPFFVFGTYSLYQLQIVGFIIGTDHDGLPCTTYCIVPWGGNRLDLNSILLYLNAITFALGGVVTMLLCAYSDYWKHKHLLVTICIICYGAFSIPAYWLQSYTLSSFETLSALYIVFQVVTLILMAIMNIYIPHCMRTASTSDASSAHRINAVTSPTTTIEVNVRRSEGVQRKYGFNMSLLGMVANGVGGTLVYVVVIILSQTLSGEAAQSSGLLVSTVVGFLTVAGSAAAFYGLPAIPSRPLADLKRSWFQPVVELFTPFKDLLVRKNMAALLISYTIYTDSAFAVSSVTGQIFVAEIRPAALEFSLYSLAQSLLLLGCSLGFLFIQRRLSIRLETWLIIGLGMLLFIPVWGCIGLSNVSFGFKKRWEFYVQLLVFQISGAFVNASFRVLLAEMIPVGSELRWYGMQLVLSCSTVWVNYVASGPLQNATNQLRFPLVISLLFLVFAFAIEVCRVTMPLFKADKEKWQRIDRHSYGPDSSERLAELDVERQSVNISEKATEKRA